VSGAKVGWEDLIRLSTVNLIIGYKGRGKSGLAYYLMETIAPKHKLLPLVVNFPREKQHLLPVGYAVKELDDALSTEKAMILVDEGTTQLPAGGKLEDFIKGASSLSRQRDQIIVFVFHTSRDVGSRILRGLDTVMIKEPSRRQIEQGAKDKWFRSLLEKAKQELQAQPGKRYQWTYVESEEPDFQGVLGNPLPSFWSEDLSKAWGGISLAGKEEQLSLEKPFCFQCDGCGRFAFMYEGHCEFCGTAWHVGLTKLY
jgi:hypothetical protein